MTSEPAPQTLLNQVCAELESSARKLHFSASIEERFQSSRRQDRIRHYVRTSIVGLFTYNLFLFSDAVLVPDVLAFSTRLHVIITLIAACNVFLVFRRIFPVEIVMVNLSLIFANALFAVHLSHSPDGVFYLFTVPLFFIYGNIALPLPFRFAAGFSTFCVAASGVTIAVQPGLHIGVKILLFSVQLCLAVYTLIATYRNETFERHSYLLTLRETLRGQTLVEQNRELSELSETDGLTGIANRRVFDRTFENLWAEHLLSRTPIALLMIDIDHFKRLNDTFGHGNGDLCLKKTASRLRALMHAHQSLARYGGEEFAVLLEGEGARKAAIVAERLRAEIEAMPTALTEGDNQSHHITISIGCATVIPRPGLSPAELFIEADKALYAAKQAGRNCVQTAASKDPQPAASSPLQVLLGS